MLRTWSRKLGLLAVLLLAILTVTVNRIGHAEKSVWTANNQNRQDIVKDKGVTRSTFPTEFKLYNLNFEPLHAQLFSIVGDANRGRTTVISLPNAAGNLEDFEVYEASNFEPDLQAMFPEIRAFSGKGLTDRYATLKLTIAPSGIQTMVFRSDTDTEFVEPYSQDHSTYAVFSSSREKGSLPWACSTEEKAAAADAAKQIPADHRPESAAGQLKTIRLAQSCNGEYANFFGATSAAQVNLVLTAFNNTIGRVNGVNERDLAIHMNLIAATTNVIYYNPATDPYTTLGSWNGQLQATLTANIGEANYDIGHMFGASGGGGNAGCIGCVCTDGQKGSGITSPADGIPQGDNFDIDYVVHEMGHQLGANHSFSHTLEGTGQNKEVGSGITIMGYAGITTQDVAPHSIDTFHETNIEQIEGNIANVLCPVTTNMTANHAPVVASVPNATIPISTPFALTGSATDQDGDALTYQWEQNDNSTTNGNASIASPTKATGPNWLSFLPTASPTRYFPKLSTVQAGLFVTPVLPGGDAGKNIEALSSVARNLNFRLTVRDNHAFVAGSTAGQTNFTDTLVTVTANAGPFKVTVPDAAGISYTGGSSQTVTWNVAGTTGNGVNTANVKISISTDGGNTFPTVLSASTPNDGTESVTIPNTVTTTARIKVEAVGNIYYDMGDNNFAITQGVVANRPVFDFDGDGKSDDAVTRDVGGNLTWYILRSTSGFTGVSWGTTASDTAVPGDYDGDGKWDTAVFRNGTFHILQSSNGAYVAVPFGAAGDDPTISQDFDNDGKTDPAVTRNVGGVLTFYVLRSTAGAYGASFGSAATDIAVRGDFDGDHKADVALYRKNTGSPANTFFVLRSSDGVVTGTTFGNYTLDYPVPGDFDGDSRTDFAVFRGRAGGDGVWYYLRSSNGAFVGQPFGAVGDRPVPGDYDNDGKTDPAVWRPGTPGTFYHLGSTSGVTGVAFGATGDIPPAFSLQAK